MKILQLDPKPKKEGTGGIFVEQFLYKAIRDIFDSEIHILSDEKMKLNGSKHEKLFSYWRYYKYIEKSDFILVNTSNRRLCFFLHFLKYRKKNMYIMVVHQHFEYLSHKKFSFKWWFCRYYEINILKSADCIVTFGKYTYDMLKKHLPNRNIKCLGVPINKEKYNISTMNPGELVFIGTIEPRKGLDYLLKALNMVRYDYNMVVIGNYDNHKNYYEKLEKKIKQYGLESKIKFTGRVSEEEKNRYLSTASAFVFPTLNEGYGIVIVEAMGHGVPVIAFNNTAIPYLVKNGVNGYLVKNKDAKDLAHKIEQILLYRDSKDVIRMSNKALETYKNSLSSDSFLIRAKKMCIDEKKRYFDFIK